MKFLEPMALEIQDIMTDGRIGKDRYYSLKDRAYNNNLSFEQLLDIKESTLDTRENSSHDSEVKEDKPNNKKKALINIKEKLKN
jgi:hypothetical protein